MNSKKHPKRYAGHKAHPVKRSDISAYGHIRLSKDQKKQG